MSTSLWNWWQPEEEQQLASIKTCRARMWSGYQSSGASRWRSRRGAGAGFAGEEKTELHEQPELGMDKRVCTFEEVELSLSEQAAVGGSQALALVR